MPARAQQSEVDIPDIVVTATRVPLPVEQIPAGVSVIDRESIYAHGYNSLIEALDDIPGLHVSQAGGPGGQTSIFIRGTEGRHVLVLRDGMPTNDPSDVNGAYTFFSSDTLADVERIEVIRGPMAAIYGSGAIGGVINMISRQGNEPGLHWNGHLAGGYPAAGQGTVTASGVDGSLDFSVTTQLQNLRGYDSTPQREYVYTGVPQGFRSALFSANLGYNLSEGTRFSLLLRGQSADSGYNTLGQTDAYYNPLPTFDDSNSNASAAQILGRIGGSTRFFDDQLDSNAFIGRIQGNRRYQEPYNINDPNQASLDAHYVSNETDIQLNNTLHLDQMLPQQVLSGSALTFGYEYIVNSANERYWSGNLLGNYTSTARASSASNAVYAGTQTKIMDKLTLTGQVRQDWMLAQAPTTWRIGSVFDVDELNTHIKAAYGTAFRAPSLYERYGVDAYGFVGNPNLRPETAKGWEVGFIKDVSLADQAKFVTISATYFDERINDLIEYVFLPTYTEANLNAAHTHGVETEARMHLFNWLDLRATWTLLTATAVGQSSDIGSNLLRRPQNTASLEVTLKPTSTLKIITSIIYTGPAEDILIGPDGNGNGTGYGMGQHGTVANVAVNYVWKPSLTLYVDGWNILNSKFEPVSGYQTPGPTVLCGVRLSL